VMEPQSREKIPQKSLALKSKSSEFYRYGGPFTPEFRVEKKARLAAGRAHPSSSSIHGIGESGVRRLVAQFFRERASRPHHGAGNDQSLRLAHAKRRA
jgi:hypothetical protein